MTEVADPSSSLGADSGRETNETNETNERLQVQTAQKCVQPNMKTFRNNRGGPAYLPQQDPFDPFVFAWPFTPSVAGAGGDALPLGKAYCDLLIA